MAPTDKQTIEQLAARVEFLEDKIVGILQYRREGEAPIRHPLLSVAQSLKEALEQPNMILELYLRNKKIKEIPEDISKLKYLETLMLQSNKLSSLPESIGELTKLKTLWIIDNEFKVLPESLCLLSNLEAAYFWGNELTSLPNNFSFISSLNSSTCVSSFSKAKVFCASSSLFVLSIKLAASLRA